MENAYKFAIECCEKLKWIYAFTYFHDLKYRKDSFEFSLGEYERYKENLLKLLAADLKAFVIGIEEMGKEGPLDESVIEMMTEKFKNLKKQIVNYYTCTKNFKENQLSSTSLLKRTHKYKLLPDNLLAPLKLP